MSLRVVGICCTATPLAAWVAMIRNKAADIPNNSVAAARLRRQLEALLLEHRPFLRGLALKLYGNRADADDLVQDVMEKLLRTAPTLPESGHGRPWLAAVLHNQFIDRLRRANARKETPQAELTEPAVPVLAHVEPWWQALSADDVQAQMANLSDELRSAFELFTYQNKSYIEIAEQLQISKATVGTRILRARQKLRELLRPTTPEEDRHE